MIDIRNVSKQYATRTGMATILKNVNLQVSRGEKIGILGRNGAGKSTLVRLISGAERPSEGVIHRTMGVSWPLAFGGAFQSTLTGLDNLRFICRIYGQNADDKIDFVQEFSELGSYLQEPIRNYSSGMRARLAFAISMVIDFDCFLIDEVISVGDARFQQKCHVELFSKRSDRSMIIISHDVSYIIDHCDKLAILNNGNLTKFENINDGIDYYHNLISL